WLNPLFKIVKTRQLRQSDLFDVLHADKCQKQVDAFNQIWSAAVGKSSQNEKPDLLLCLLKHYGVTYMLLGIIFCLHITCTIIQPFFVGWLISYFAVDSEMTIKEACLYAAGLSLVSMSISLTKQCYSFMSYRLGIQTTIFLSAAIFQKTLKLNSHAMSKTSTGHIVNLLANDALHMKDTFQFLHMLWIGPLLVITMCILLWQQIGIASLAGLFVLVAMIAQQSAFLKLLMKFRRKYLKFADQRVRIMNEIIASMRMIKMYAWEVPFAKRIKQLRRDEVDRMYTGFKFYSVNAASFLLLNTITSFTTITVYVLLGNTITAAKVFTVYAMLNSLQIALSIGIPEAVRAITDARVSFGRIEKHLMLEEFSQNHQENIVSENDSRIVIDGISAKWGDGFGLNDISITVPKGKLYSIVGPVGCGKTSVIMTLLGELPYKSGKLSITGRMAYAPQQPWIFSGTIKENILFGSTFDEDKYHKIIEACALVKDLQQLPNGDETYVGERGMRLSGGQKARVSLARAVYLDADIYIMDDPLSAVDIEVARHLYDKCICGLLKDRTRILVTHQIQLLSKADQIIILENGSIHQSGLLSELIQNGVNFTKLLHVEDTENLDEEISKNELDSKKDSALQDEQRDEGKISYKTYLLFLSSGNGISFFIFLLFVSVASQTLTVITDWWLSRWSDNFTTMIANGSNTSILNEKSIFGLTNGTTIIIYSCLLIGSWILTSARCILCIKLVMDSARSFHHRMLKSILEAPIYFFDTNPVGRVLNRFSKDLSSIDGELPFTTLQVIQVILKCNPVIGVILVFNPWVLIPAVVLVISFIFIRSYYLSLSREVTRLAAVASSPIYSHISTTLHGLTTIRALKSEELFMKQFISYQDNHTKAAIVRIALLRWNAFHVDILSSFYLTCVAFAGILAANTVSAGGIGLSLSYTILLLGNFQWLIRQSAELENQMTSVERIKEYSEISPEDEALKAKLPKNWPVHGRILFKNLSFRHHESLPYVLHNINCAIEAGEKIGVVGRTGAGKSSLVASLFRMADLSGNIEIDDISITSVNVSSLRSKISVIPQDPSLFVGTLRDNLDPFGEYDDIKLWNTLEEVQLSSYIRQLPGKLDSNVSEAGSNFSIGQRQLLCLGRAILRKNKILVVDEATANVDFNTDEFIQKSIKTKFQHSTVITIAHRLNTVIECDRIMLFRDGRLVEFDHPFALLQNMNSEFAKMVMSIGTTEFTRLMGVAMKNRIRSKSVAHNIMQTQDRNTSNAAIRIFQNNDTGHVCNTSMETIV
ncbi:uncharacterized protein TRIADDRAFT_22415, partial [Trichoplax adhaerens]